MISFPQYITWVNDGKVAWTLNAAGVGADSDTEISARPVPGETHGLWASFTRLSYVSLHVLDVQYILANLGMSTNFGDVDLDHLTFPAIMLIDWIRVYQVS